MPRENINISNPNDGLGDKLRASFNLTNKNFIELYANKVDKIAGKGLSSNDYTTTEQQKLLGIEIGAEVNVQADFSQSDNTADNYIKNKPPTLYAGVGYFRYADSASQTTPLTIVANVDKKLTNDKLGVANDTAQSPYGVVSLWDSATNAFNFTELAIGDTIDLKVKVTPVTAVAFAETKLIIKFAVGSLSEFTEIINISKTLSGALMSQTNFSISFPISNPNVRDYPTEIYFNSDVPGTLKIDDFYLRVLRKNLQLIPFETMYGFGKWRLQEKAIGNLKEEIELNDLAKGRYDNENYCVLGRYKNYTLDNNTNNPLNYEPLSMAGLTSL